MTDTVNLTLALDKTTYNKGDLMTLSVSGTVTSASTSGTATVGANVRAADGSIFTLPAATASVVTPGTSLSYALSSISDLSGRVWTIASNGLSATATA